mgnify:CR=1 FL=1
MISHDADYIPARGDIVWTNFDPARGREQKGDRTALVVSTRELNKWGLAYIIPITSKQKGYPIEVPIRGGQVQGVALTSHLRAVDWRERSVRFIEYCPEDALLRVLGQIVSFLSEK